MAPEPISSSSLAGHARALWWAAGALLAFRFAYPLYLTVAQWHAWSQYSFTKLLLTLPLDAAVPLPFFLEPFRSVLAQPGGYFAFHAWGRFWLPSLLAVMAAGVVGACMAALRKARPGSVSREEILLFCAAALFAGWPNVVLSAPLTLLGAALLMGVQEWRGARLPVWAPAIIGATCIVVVFGSFLIFFFNLEVLRL